MGRSSRSSLKKEPMRPGWSLLASLAGIIQYFSMDSAIWAGSRNPKPLTALLRAVMRFLSESVLFLQRTESNVWTHCRRFQRERTDIKPPLHGDCGMLRLSAPRVEGLQERPPPKPLPPEPLLFSNLPDDPKQNIRELFPSCLVRMNQGIPKQFRSQEACNEDLTTSVRKAHNGRGLLWVLVPFYAPQIPPCSAQEAPNHTGKPHVGGLDVFTVRTAWAAGEAGCRTRPFPVVSWSE